MKALFLRKRVVGYKLLVWAFVSCVVIVVDVATPYLQPLRSALGSALAPLYSVAHSPYVLVDKAGDVVATRERLIRRNQALEDELLHMKSLVSRYDFVAREYASLRQLSESRAQVRNDTLIAELVALSSAPAEVVIDKGSATGVAVGQAVVDATGLLGQVVATSALTSRVLLIVDPAHSVPVQVLRNNVRAIATGAGAGRLVLKDVAVTLDIREGDRLVSSGLGGRFPRGYDVGVVQSVVRDQTEPFTNISVRPSAALDRAGHVLVVFADDGPLGRP